jgi:hypothetical protein
MLHKKVRTKELGGEGEEADGHPPRSLWHCVAGRLELRDGVTRKSERWQAVSAGKCGALVSRACGQKLPGSPLARRRRLVFKCIDNPPPRRRCRLLSHALLLSPRPPAELSPPPRAHDLKKS